jgi:hypothetical protein
MINWKMQIYCGKCKKLTSSPSDSIVFQRVSNRFRIFVVCAVCKETKCKFLSYDMMLKLPKEIFDTENLKIYIDQFNHNDGTVVLFREMLNCF